MQFKDLLKRYSDVERYAAQRREKPAPGKSVVVAEKQHSARETIVAQVMDLGYVPLITSNGDQALEMARQYQPRLVVADVDLENTGGREVLAALRQDEATRGIAVILVGNTEPPPDLVPGGETGPDDYVRKPIDGPTIKARIRQLLLKGAQEVTFQARRGWTGQEPQPGETPAQAAPQPPPGEHFERAEKLHAESCEFAKDTMSRAVNTEPPNIDWCRDLAGRLVRECERSNRLLLKAIRPYEPGESNHDAANVAIFSIKIGRGLGYDADELTSLAMAALCHEVGMSCVPAEVAAAEGKYTRKQWDQIRQHPEHAYQILSKLGENYRWLAETVRQEHEREQGQGYPRQLRGGQITEFAKIIGLADTYESLSHLRRFRKAFIGFDALREIIGMRGKYFAPYVIRALVSEVSVFPLESYVLLNTGETARVVDTNPDNLLRPVVVVEYDASGQKLRRPKIIDLASKPLLHVTKPVDERDLAKRDREVYPQ